MHKATIMRANMFAIASTSLWTKRVPTDAGRGHRLSWAVLIATAFLQHVAGNSNGKSMRNGSTRLMRNRTRITFSELRTTNVSAEANLRNEPVAWELLTKDQSATAHGRLMRNATRRVQVQPPAARSRAEAELRTSNVSAEADSRNEPVERELLTKDQSATDHGRLMRNATRRVQVQPPAARSRAEAGAQDELVTQDAERVHGQTITIHSPAEASARTDLVTREVLPNGQTAAASPVRKRDPRHHKAGAFKTTKKQDDDHNSQRTTAVVGSLGDMKIDTSLLDSTEIFAHAATSIEKQTLEASVPRTLVGGATMTDPVATTSSGMPARVQSIPQESRFSSEDAGNLMLACILLMIATILIAFISLQLRRMAVRESRDSRSPGHGPEWSVQSSECLNPYRYSRRPSSRVSFRTPRDLHQGSKPFMSFRGSNNSGDDKGVAAPPEDALWVTRVRSKDEPSREEQ